MNGEHEVLFPCCVFEDCWSVTIVQMTEKIAAFSQVVLDNYKKESKFNFVLNVHQRNLLVKISFK